VAGKEAPVIVRATMSAQTWTIIRMTPTAPTKANMRDSLSARENIWGMEDPLKWYCRKKSGRRVAARRPPPQRP